MLSTASMMSDGRTFSSTANASTIAAVSPMPSLLPRIERIYEHSPSHRHDRKKTTMRTKYAALSIVLCAVALAGCSASSGTSASPTPTATVEPNAAACADVASLSQTVPNVINDGTGKDPWGDLRIEFDDISLRATGDVKTRIERLVSEWPEYVDVKLWNEVDDLNALFDGIDRACAADGHDVEIAQFTTSS